MLVPAADAQPYRHAMQGESSWPMASERGNVTWAADISPAITNGKALGIAWPSKGGGHNVRAWAELLVLQRAATPGAAYAPCLGAR